MAIFKIFPEKDTTIYSQYPNLNSGLDEIIELSTELNSVIVTGNNYAQNAEVSRILIQFSSASISDLMFNKIGNTNWKAYLRLYLAKASSIPENYTIYSYPLSASWSMGSGRRDNVPESTDGASWTYRTLTTLWSITGSSFISGAFAASQSFTPFNTQDVEMDVTNIVLGWVSGSYSNNGILVKHSSSIEFNTSSLFELKFFSRDTHTIYPPCLEFRYNDHSYTTGSLSSSIVPTNNQIIVSLGNNKGEYQQNTIQRFNINVRDKFPTRQFTTSSVYLNNKLLPSQSFWSLKDLHTEEIVFDFDSNYTVINCDATSSYFKIDMSSVEPERNYRILIKTIIGSETLIFDDESLTFKVKR